MSYEKKVEKLEGIVKKLDTEKISLEESLKMYAEGIKLTKDCLKELGELKGQFELLNADMEKIEIIEEND